MFGFGKDRQKQDPNANWRMTFTEDAVLFANSVEAKLAGGGELLSFLHQLEDEGYAESAAGSWRLSWESIYALLGNSAYAGSLSLLNLPEMVNAAPILESRGSLTDRDFAVTISGWFDLEGRHISVSSLHGAILQTADGPRIMRREVWRLWKGIIEFNQRTSVDCNDAFHRKSWGQIRQAAIAANARLDDFLYRTVVLTPERLTINLRKAELEALNVVEIVPSFDSCPDGWLTLFDRLATVPERYDLATPQGIAQVIVTPQVRSVLSQIKRMPGRRMAGTRAEAFVSNPFATLGDDASAVIDPDQFEQARVAADLLYERFTARIERDAWGYPTEVGLLIETSGKATGVEPASIRYFGNDDELSSFIGTVQEKLDAGYQLCAWEGYEFELLGDTPDQLKQLAQALEDRAKPKVLVSYAQIFDLSAYSSRIEGIGAEKPYYSPFIAKKRDDAGWFPENLVPVISWTPDGEAEPIAIPATPPILENLKAKVAEAKATGSGTIKVDGIPKPLSVVDAETILEAFDAAFEKAKNGTFDPTVPRTKEIAGKAPNLVVKANIRSIDYEETRRDILLTVATMPELPRSMRSGISLKGHQNSGVAWLQHLFSESPDYCRGCVLADDMGLGKTLQLLTLIAWAFEKEPGLAPALVVAPLSLLENWQEEAARFFVDGALPILTAYGSELTALRVPRSSIDAALQNDGLVKFLKPSWRGSAKIVLTTYETLRDLEFSFAAERWSIMVCDEAQKIKNPNALMTRAAKKQNVRFKIACTGTPVENTLADLWCLFDFVQPGMLGALNDFGQRYRRPIEAETDEQRARVEELRHKIQPQILRRTKKEVAKDLPQKVDVVECRKLPLSTHQRTLYAQAVDVFRRRQNPDAVVPFKNHLGLLHYLRLLCTDPRRYGFDAFKPQPLASYRKQAPKIDWLLQTLQTIKARREKAIIFCEFRNIQRMLRHYIEEVLHYAPDIINGSTSASTTHVHSRQKRIKAFQAGQGFGVIILSPMAVGFGMNIQAANHVIHYTRTWNPAKEDQATDRAYRIGQERDVYVYCPVVSADDFTTFDVKLDQLLSRKRALADDMLNGSSDIRPSEFDIADVVPGGSAAVGNSPITLDDALNMNASYFECLIAALWQARGYRVVERTPDSGDGGVDVVAFSGGMGELVQCKTSSRDNAKLSWDAIKDVVTGEAAYRMRFPDVVWKKACVTNQYFNQMAIEHAQLNDVELHDQSSLSHFLQKHPITLLEIERFLLSEWDHV